MVQAAVTAKNFFIMLRFFILVSSNFLVWMADDPDLARGRGRSGNKKSLCPTMGQKLLLLRYHPN